MKGKSPCDLKERAEQQLLFPKASQSIASLPQARERAENRSLAAWMRGGAVPSKGTRTATSGCRDISTEWLGMAGGPGVLPKAQNPLPLPLHEGCTTAGGPGCPSQTSSQLPCQQLTAVRVGIQKNLPLPSAKQGIPGQGRWRDRVQYHSKDHSAASLAPGDPGPACPCSQGMPAGCSHLALQGTFTPFPTTQGQGCSPQRRWVRTV